MKQINIYFGKQQESVLGSYADVVKIIVEDDEIRHVLDSLTGGRNDWVSVKIPNGVKCINVKNILWFDIIDTKEDK